MSKGLNNKFLRNTERFLRKRAIDTRSFGVTHKTPPTEIKFLGNGGAGVFNFVPLTFGSCKLESPPSELTGTSLPGYWLPQGKYIDIAKKAPLCKTLFTGELTGCSIYVHELNATTLRVFHVHMSHVAEQYTSVTKGAGGPVCSLVFNDYNGGGERKAAVAVLRYKDSGSWHLYYQKIELTRTAGAPRLTVWGRGDKAVT